jgi:hypothetical protein
MVTMSACILRARACVDLSVSRSLLVVHPEKSGTASTSVGNGKKLAGYVSVVKNSTALVTQHRTTCSFLWKQASCVSVRSDTYGASG